MRDSSNIISKISNYSLAGKWTHLKSKKHIKNEARNKAENGVNQSHSFNFQYPRTSLFLDISDSNAVR